MMRALDAIYASIMIFYEKFQSKDRTTISQLLGGDNKEINKQDNKQDRHAIQLYNVQSEQTSKPRQGAEMFYMLFAAIVKNIKNLFDSNNNNEFTFDFAPKFDSKFRAAYDFVVKNENGVTLLNFEQYCYIMNKLWDQGSGDN